MVGFNEEGGVDNIAGLPLNAMWLGFQYFASEVALLGEWGWVVFTTIALLDATSTCDTAGIGRNRRS